MDIGKKLKKSRMKCNLSQEDVSEKLNITRQTLSNWENNKCYPDILNVIELSKLYNICIDELIKDEEMINNIKLSLDIVSKKEKMIKYMLVILYLFIWSISILSFWIFTVNSHDPLARDSYVLTILFVLLPVLSFILSFIIGKEKWKSEKLFIPFFFGIMYMLIEYTTFKLFDMLKYTKFNFLDIISFNLFILVMLISYLGVLIGIIYSKIKKIYIKNRL